MPASIRQRRGLVTAVADVRSPTAKIKPGALHSHGCIVCGLVYQDACTRPMVDGVCSCRRAHGRPTWLVDREPQACCRLYSQPIHDLTTLERFALGGRRTWYQCKSCFRTHPTDPRE